MNINWLRTYRLITTVHTLSAVFHNPSSSWTKCKHPPPMAVHNFIISSHPLVILCASPWNLLSAFEYETRTFWDTRDNNWVFVWVGPVLIGALFSLGFIFILNCSLLECRRLVEVHVRTAHAAAAVFLVSHFVLTAFLYPPWKCVQRQMCWLQIMMALFFFIFNITSLLTILNLLSYLAS